MAKQIRSSAGTFISINGKNIILDPGPGTLVKCAASEPPIDLSKVDAVILSHAHLDHSNDVNVVIDAITEGGLKKRGVLFAPDQCLNGDDAVVLNYLRHYLQEITVLRASSEYHVGEEVAFKTSIRHVHGVETYGIKFDVDGLKVSFMVDTKYFPELIDDYAGSDILILNVVIDKPHPEYGKVQHLYYDDAATLIKAIRPKKAVLTHFGMTMLAAKPWKLAEELSDKLGVDVVPATDGMRIDLA